MENINYVYLKVLGCHHESFAITQHLEGFGMTVGGFFFPFSERHYDCGTAESASQNDNFKNQFASKFSADDDTSRASGSGSVEIVNAFKKRNCNKCAAYFESDSSSSNSSHFVDEREILSLSESGNLDGSSSNHVRPIAQVCIPVPENDNVELINPISEDESRNVKGRNDM